MHNAPRFSGANFSFSWLQPALAFSLRIYSKAGWYEDFRLRRVLDLDKFRHRIVEQPSSWISFDTGLWNNPRQLRAMLTLVCNHIFTESATSVGHFQQRLD